MGIKETLLLDDLKQHGYNFADINHLYKQSEPLPIVACDIILDRLPEIYSEHIGSGECLVRALISAGEPFDPTVLIDLFVNSNLNDTLKCTIGYVLSISKTYDIDKWLRDQLLNQEHSFKRAGLISGIVPKGKFQTKEELKAFLVEIFDKYSYYEDFLKLFQKYGPINDVPFLEQKSFEADTKRKSREILRIAEKIKNRRRIPKFHSSK